MTGDEEAARQDAQPSGTETRSHPIAPAPADGDVPAFEPLQAADTAAESQPRSSVVADTPLVEPASMPRERSLAPLWIVMIAGLVVMAGALAYLFSLLPDPNRLAATERSVADLQAKVAAPPSKLPTVDTGALTARLDAADKAIADLKSEVSTLKTPTPASTMPAAPSADLAPLAAKVADLDQSVATLRSSLPDTVKQGTTGLDDRLSALSAKVDGLPKIDLGPLTAQVNGLDARLKPIAAEYEAAKSPARVTTVRENGSAAETRAAPLAVTAEAVQRAIDAGRPLGADLKVLARLGASPDRLAPLQAVAETGAPTIKDLQADLANMREKIGAQAQPSPTGSYLDRLMSGAATMVQVRPLGSVVGDKPPAVLARMDDDLAHDDLSGVLTEYARLPEADRTIGQSFAARVRLRQAAQDAARTIGTEAISAMAADQP